MSAAAQLGDIRSLREPDVDAALELRALGAWRLERSGAPGRWSAPATASLLLHGLAFALVAIGAAGSALAPPPEPIPVDIVFETPSPAQPAAAVAPAEAPSPQPSVSEAPPAVEPPPPVAEAPPAPPLSAEAPPEPPPGAPAVESPPPLAEAPPAAPLTAEAPPAPVPEARPIVEPPPAETETPPARPAPPHAASKAPPLKPVRALATKPPPKPALAERDRPRVASLPRAAEPPASRAATSNGEAAAYQGAVLSRIAAHKRYPEAALERAPQGLAVVRFTLDGQGDILVASLAKSAGDALLDADALATVRRSAPFGAPPAGAPRVFSAPLNYRAR